MVKIVKIYLSILFYVIVFANAVNESYYIVYKIKVIFCYDKMLTFHFSSH